MSASVEQNVLVPMKVDAFIFNKAVCDAELDEPGNDSDDNYQAKIAPITQPNYSLLRLDQQYLQSDIQNHVDLHSAWPAETNSRFTDLGTGQPRVNRQGVYIHWTLPRVYRSGIAATKSDQAHKDARLARSLAATEKQNVDPNTPDFPCVPTRWLIVRSISDVASVQPPSAWNEGLKLVCAWVVESDRRWTLDNLGDDIDLQVDVSPFIFAKDAHASLQDQAEIFIGKKTALSDWTEVKAPRIQEFKLMNSSNQLFADYQPHCSNVFSIVDRFEYGPEGAKKRLTEANSNYYIAGWHTSDSPDLFNTPMERRQRLSELQMEIKGSKQDSKVNDFFKDWLDASTSTSAVVHGAIYNVKWNVAKKPDNVPADDACEFLNSTLPVAVGTTPMDALLTYAKAHKGLDGGDPAVLEKLLVDLERYLLARDDGVEAKQQASDLLYNWNFGRYPGGKRFFVVDNNDGRPTSPPEDLEALKSINQEQQFLDAIERRITRLRWTLFSEWWKDVTDSVPSDKRRAETAERVGILENDIKKLELQHKSRQEKIARCLNPSTFQTFQPGEKSGEKYEPGVLAAFYQQRDPTLLIGGVESGWERDFLDTLTIRLDSQSLGDERGKTQLTTLSTQWEDLLTLVKAKLPDNSGINASVKFLLQEFLLLEPEKPKSSYPGVKQLPLFHDQFVTPDGKKGPWRDRWNNTQPWFPLFLEWEIEYTHFVYDDFVPQTVKLHDDTLPVLRSGIKEGLDIEQKYGSVVIGDKRIFSGRSLVLPQPSFSLEAKIKQLFSDTPSGNKPILDPGDQKRIETELYKLAFLSTPLDGMTAHFTTNVQGTHVKPVLHLIEKVNEKERVTYQPIDGANRDKSGLVKTTMARIQDETDLTPYWTSMKPADRQPLFKPVTHGQVKFNKVNIIDKFGQAIHAIDPRPSESPQKLFPCISDWYAPQHLKSSPKVPNVVHRDEDDPEGCEYFQIPPQINQQARLNASWVVPYSWEAPTHEYCVTVNPSLLGGEQDLPTWRSINEWENPIWGWVVINYANYGIQTFLPDGQFYREVRFTNADNKPLVSPEWLPFSPPKNPNKGSPGMRQLKLLVNRLMDKDYLDEFVGMINRASACLQAGPDAYAEFTSALIGRPLALANVGWSLELATDAFVSQADGDLKLPKMLIGGAKGEQYEFSIKVGDKQRGFDGLVCYFNPGPKENIPFGDALDLKTFYTDFDGSEEECNSSTMRRKTDGKFIRRSKYQKFQPFWVDPRDITAEDYSKKRDSNLVVLGVMVDPFSPIHAYSSILPVEELSLQSWTWQAALNRMKAFFHMGPVISVEDVEPFQAGRELTADGPQLKLPDREKGDPALSLPGINGTEWAWLQPYMIDPPKKPDDPPGNPGDPPKDPPCVEIYEKFMPLPVETADTKAVFLTQPYTALDGYLQMTSSRLETKGS